MAKGYLAYKLTDASRAAVLQKYPEHYEHIVCSHITYQFDVPEGTKELPPQPESVVVVAEVDDGRGVQALVAEVNGDTHRPHGGTFHITESLGPGRKAVESNDLVDNEENWQPVEPLSLEVVPAWIPA